VWRSTSRLPCGHHRRARRSSKRRWSRLRCRCTTCVDAVESCRFPTRHRRRPSAILLARPATVNCPSCSRGGSRRTTGPGRSEDASFTPTSHWLPNASSWRPNAKAERGAPHFVGFDVRLVERHIATARAVKAGEVVGAEVRAPVAVVVHFDEGADVVREVRLEVQARALFNESASPRAA
jgi:hypothetical protein